MVLQIEMFVGSISGMLTKALQLGPGIDLFYSWRDWLGHRGDLLQAHGWKQQI